ncbi:MAG: hypothetical protein OEZ58_15345 [Gammaproteobacteria bacterium]|nr:hypothetical protein [Gammaproteobacteria bacterium]MDH5730370.1 hypothetical protein [Gammaproteobacteria bacterium]
MLAIPRDKLLHGLIGYTIGISLVFYSTPLAMAAIVIVGIGIEIYQLRTRSGKYEVFDMIAVFVGGTLAAIYYHSIAPAITQVLHAAY